MQEEVTRKTVALSVETGKMTAHVLQKAMKKVLEDMAKAKNQPRLHHGKQPSSFPMCFHFRHHKCR